MCGKTACTVRREGRLTPAPTPIKAAGATWLVFVRFGRRPQEQMVSQEGTAQETSLTGFGPETNSPLKIEMKQVMGRRGNFDTRNRSRLK